MAFVFIVRQGQPMPDETQLDRIEHKLDALLALLVDDGEDEPHLTLDGEAAGAERDGGTPL